MVVPGGAVNRHPAAAAPGTAEQPPPHVIASRAKRPPYSSALLQRLPASSCPGPSALLYASQLLFVGADMSPHAVTSYEPARATPVGNRVRPLMTSTAIALRIIGRPPGTRTPTAEGCRRSAKTGAEGARPASRAEA